MPARRRNHAPHTTNTTPTAGRGDLDVRGIPIGECPTLRNPPKRRPSASERGTSERCCPPVTRRRHGRTDQAAPPGARPADLSQTGGRRGKAGPSGEPASSPGRGTPGRPSTPAAPCGSSHRRYTAPTTRGGGSTSRPSPTRTPGQHTSPPRLSRWSGCSCSSETFHPENICEPSHRLLPHPPGRDIRSEQRAHRSTREGATADDPVDPMCLEGGLNYVVLGVVGGWMHPWRWVRGWVGGWCVVVRWGQAARRVVRSHPSRCPAGLPAVVVRLTRVSSFS